MNAVLYPQESMLYFENTLKLIMFIYQNIIFCTNA